MKQIKIFLIAGFILLFIAAAAVGYVWFKVQHTLQEASVEESVQVTPPFVESEETPVANTVPDEGIKIDTSAVSAEQKAVAEKVGIDLDTVVITPEMVSCAELKLGSARIAEIINGASPTALESISLLGCL